MRRLIIFITIISCTMAECLAYGIYTDPTRTAVIMNGTKKSTKILGMQLGLQSGVTATHVVTIQQIKDVNKFQREFNEYLDTIRNAVCIAAQLYGLYYEADKCIDYMGQISKVVQEHPLNAVALSVSVNRNKIYGDVIDRTTDVLNDIYSVCFSKAKMTVKERWEVIAGIRPKMKSMNRDLRKLCLFIKYTTLNDVWREMTGMGDRFHLKSRQEIALACHEAWTHKFNPDGI